MADASRSLPVFETVGQSLGYSFRNIGLMIRLSWFWSILLVVLFVALTVPPSDAVQIEGRAGWDGVAIAGFAVLMIVYFVALYSIAVGWHRALLLGEQPGWINFNAGRREAGYLGYMLLIALLSSLPMMTGFLIAGALSLSSGVSRGMLVFMATFVGLAGFVIMLLIMGRLQLVLPGVAVGDRRISIRQSLDLTRGNSWRILGGLLLISLIQIVPNILSALGDPGVLGLDPMTGLALSAAAVPFWIILGFVALSYMSFCYWFFVPPPQEGDLE